MDTYFKIKTYEVPEYCDFAKNVFSEEMFDEGISLLENGQVLYAEIYFTTGAADINAVVFDKRIGMVECTFYASTDSCYRICDCPIDTTKTLCKHIMAAFNFYYLLEKQGIHEYGSYTYNKEEKTYTCKRRFDDDLEIKLSDLDIDSLKNEKPKIMHHLQTRTKKPALESSPSLQSFFNKSLKIVDTKQVAVPDGSVELIQCIDFPKEQLDKAIFHMSFYIKAGRKYKIKNIPDFAEAVTNKDFYTFGKFLAFTLSPSMFDEKSKTIYEIIKGEEIGKYPNLYRSYENKAVSRIECSCSMLPKLISPYIGDQIKIGKKNYNVVDENPRLEIHISKYCDGLVNINFPVLYNLFTANDAWLLQEDTIYKCTEDFVDEALPIIKAFNALACPVKDMDSVQCINYLSEDDFTIFCAEMLNTLEKYFDVHFHDINFEPYLPPEPLFEFYFFTNKEDEVCCIPKAVYGNKKKNLFVSGKDYRNKSAEAPVRAELLKYMQEELNGSYLRVVSDEHAFGLLKSGFANLKKFGDIYIDKSLNDFRISPPVQTNIGVSLGGNLINLDVSVDKFSKSELKKILSAYTHKKKYYKLKNGNFLDLENSSLSVLAELNNTMHIDTGNLKEVQVSMFRANAINQILAKHSAHTKIERSTEFKKLVRNINNYIDSDYKLPDTITGSLRNYQKDGYRWLCTLTKCGLDGILADDMGLGKSLQIISLLSYFKESQESALIVCPATLIYNWEAEFKKFYPSQDITLILGSAAERKNILKDKSKSRICITSYDLLKRDIEMYKDMKFDFCIADEAQYIRNPKTQAAKSIKQINAKHRFALTGTPIENKLADLWSIFDFIMPGYLFSYSEFKKEYEEPIVAGDEDKLAQLRTLTNSFILRRQKSSVLKELPEKIETIHLVEMGAEQQKLYDAYAQELKNVVSNSSESEFKKSKIKVLSMLTRLRQLCCSPELFLDGYDQGSSKVEACMEILKNSSEEGHSTLVFSQFTTMLEILCSAADDAGLSYLYLSGKNTKEQRRDMVKAFQSGKYDVFFISLKAGGTGLNLTQADRVVHFDPWWNYAAEQQASDRTHRIGQQNSVYITKLVAKDTIEERVIALQEKKKDLSESIISGKATENSKFTKEEILQLLNI